MDESTLMHNINLQLSEIEMLMSMYCKESEFVLDDPKVVADMQECVDGRCPLQNVQSRIGFCVNLQIRESKMLLEVVTELPHAYPKISPEILLRSSHMTKSAHKSISDDLQSYINNDMDQEELKMYFILQWLEDNAAKYMKKSCSQENETAINKGSIIPVMECTFTRMWIYSHHIYSKFKRKDILQYASEFDLTGFSMPGKPAILVVEGYCDKVEAFWSRLKQMQWKKIVMKEREDFSTLVGNIDSLRIFEKFEEKFFNPRQSKGHGLHCDRGMLYQYLQQKGCSHVFQYYFGVDGK